MGFGNFIAFRAAFVFSWHQTIRRAADENVPRSRSWSRKTSGELRLNLAFLKCYHSGYGLMDARPGNFDLEMLVDLSEAEVLFLE